MFALLLATTNAHKSREFTEILGADFIVRDLRQLPNAPVIEENGRSFAENAELKAVAVSRLTSELVVADDSGLEVEALGGAPGIYSARYAGPRATDNENIRKLLAALEGQPGGKINRHARFCCAIALARRGVVEETFHGEVTGTIAPGPSGGNGFGYDPIFRPDGFDRTFAELATEIKNRISHRAAAIARLRDYLSSKRSAPNE